jgi:hypothetical protein
MLQRDNFHQKKFTCTVLYVHGDEESADPEPCYPFDDHVAPDTWARERGRDGGREGRVRWGMERGNEEGRGENEE